MLAVDTLIKFLSYVIVSVGSRVFKANDQSKENVEKQTFVMAMYVRHESYQMS